MITRLTIGLLLATLLPLAAHGQECLTVHVEHDEHGPQVVETEGWPEISFPGRMGDDLWFQWDGEPFSVDVADPAIESVTACADGSVDVHREEPTVEVPAELVDLIVVLVRLSLIF